MYDSTQALTWFQQQSWFATRVVEEPLLGAATGKNVAFRVNSPPFSASDAPVVYTLSDSGRFALAVATSYPTTGLINLFAGVTGATGATYTVTPPIYQPRADYLAQVVSDASFLNFFVRGFQEMQSRHPRAIYLYQNQGVYEVSGSATASVDPVLGGVAFSQSPQQIDFLLACVELVLLRMLSAEATFNSISYREERVGGLSVDSSRRARDFTELLTRIEADIAAKYEAVRRLEGDESDFGFFDPGPELVDGEWV